MNINEQIEILEAYRDGEEIRVFSIKSSEVVFINVGDSEFDIDFNFNFQSYTYSIVRRELKHEWQPMETIPTNTNVDLLTKNGVRHVNIGTRNISYPNTYAAWMDTPLLPEWIKENETT